jgi:hypothetical protein
MWLGRLILIGMLGFGVDRLDKGWRGVLTSVDRLRDGPEATTARPNAGASGLRAADQGLMAAGQKAVSVIGCLWQ